MARTRVIAASLFFALIALSVVMVNVSAAEAHSYPVSSSPAADTTIDVLPDRFAITVNEPLLDISGAAAGFALHILDSEGTFYGDGCIELSDATMSVGASLGTSGDYRMIWQLVSEDGHPVSGEIDFTWDAPRNASASPGSTTAPDCNGTRGKDSYEDVSPGSTAKNPARGNADLSDILWIAGAVVAILVAALGTVLVMSRRRNE